MSLTRATAAASGERELADIWLVQRRAAWEVREGLAPVLPTSHRWIGAELRLPRRI